MRNRCAFCRAKRALVRIDRSESGRYPDERGLGHRRCANPSCKSHEYDDDAMATMSPGRRLVLDLKRHMAFTGHRWTVRHHGYVSRALGLAIEAGLEFYPWDGEFIAFGERDYRIACNTGARHERNRSPANTSAARAIEKKWGRPPFILAGKRMCCGSTFWWADADSEVAVTSIRQKDAQKNSPVSHYLVCAKRAPVEGAKWSETKNVACYKITPAELRAAAREGKAKWSERDA